MFRSIVFSAVLVGIITGIAVSLMQMVGTTPLILQAETYEHAAPAAHVEGAHEHAPGTPEHSHAVTAALAEAHDHDHGEGWSPADGFERTAYTLAANILTAIGYALVVTSVLSVAHIEGGWRTGLMVGFAGFASVMLAPMLGLPPELPGTPAADLGARQTWWIATACATAGGIALIAYRREAWSAALGVLLIAAPHLIGAPLAPEGAHALAPESLERKFVVAVVVTSLIFWALLGSLSGAFLKRFETAR